MSLSIRTNIASIAAQSSVAKNQSALDSSLSRLSSGYRITKAGDDAAGLAISEKLRAQISGLNQASRNANDGISMIQTAEGALQEVHTMLQRMRELAVQASNDTLASGDRSMIDTELQQLKDEVNGISGRTKFNGMALLDGSLVTSQAATSTALKGTVLATNDDATLTDVDVSGARASDTYTLAKTANSAELVLTRSSDSVSQKISVSDVAANGTQTLNFSELGVRLVVQSDAAGKDKDDLIADLDTLAVDTSAGSGSANFQIGSQSTDAISVAFSKVDISQTGIKTLDDALTAFDGSQTVGNAQSLIDAVDAGISAVSSRRAALGAFQNRLDHTIANLATTGQNLSASESRIRDVDVAEETSKMTRQQILMQAGVSVLAQANQTPQLALKLLGG